MTIQTIIDSLPDNATDLKKQCSTSVCDGRLLEHLDVGLQYALKLTKDIKAITAHLEKLKDKLS